MKDWFVSSCPDVPFTFIVLLWSSLSIMMDFLFKLKTFLWTQMDIVAPYM